MVQQFSVYQYLMKPWAGVTLKFDPANNSTLTFDQKVVDN